MHIKVSSVPGTQRAPNKCWLVLGPQQRSYQRQSPGSVSRLQEHKQRQGAPGQKDSIRVMGEASALQAPQRRGGDEGRP